MSENAARTITAELNASDGKGATWTATAFLITPSLAVTADREWTTRALRSRRQRQRGVKPIGISARLPDGDRGARVLMSEPEVGCSILRLERPASIGPVELAVMFGTDPSPGATWHCALFGAGAGGEVEPPRGEVVGIEGDGPGRRLRLRCTSALTGGVPRAIDGAPILVDGEVVGMIWKADPSGDWLAVPLTEILREADPLLADEEAREKAAAAVAASAAAMRAAAAAGPRSDEDGDDSGVPAQASVETSMRRDHDHGASDRGDRSPRPIELPASSLASLSPLSPEPARDYSGMYSPSPAPYPVAEIAPEVTVPSREPPSGEDPRLLDGLSLSATAEECVRWGAALAASVASPAGSNGETPLVDAVFLFAGMLLQGEGYTDPRSVSSFLREQLAEDRGAGPLDARDLLRRSFYSVEHLPPGPLERLPPRFLSDEARQLLRLAAAHGELTAPDGRTYARHLAAALLLGPAPGAPMETRPLAVVLGAELAVLCEELRRFIEATHPDDAIDGWLRIFGQPRLAPPEAPPVAEYAPDTASGDDQLGIGVEVAAISTLIAAADLEPPLAIGLLGPSGSGKSFFLWELEQRVEALAVTALHDEALGRIPASCPRVAQVGYNAWHHAQAPVGRTLLSLVVDAVCAALPFAAAQPEEARAALLSCLDSTGRLVREARLRREDAERGRRSAEEALRRVREDLRAHTVRLGELGAVDVSAQVRADSRLAQRIAAAAEEVGAQWKGLPASDLGTQLAELRAAAGRLGALLADPQGSDAAVIGTLLVPPLVAGGLAALLAQAARLPFVEGAGAAAAGLTLLVVVAVALRRGAGRIARTVVKLDEVKREVDRAIEERRKKLAQDEAEIRARVAALSEDERAALTRLGDAERRVKEAERVLADAQSGRLTLAADVAAPPSLAVLRADFAKLGEILGRNARDPVSPGSPRIDRVLVYVDDLDRCTPERIVEVLEAAHILLGFPLFVAVIGADPRALEEAVAPRKAAAGEAPPAHSYLEKVLQIPFTLRPMPASGYGRLVGTLVAPRYETDSSAQALLPRPSVRPAKATRTVYSVVAPNPMGAGTSDSANLNIRSWELQFLVKLGGLVPTPRAAKRLVNLYRLLRNLLPPEELVAFVGDPGHPDDHRAALLLLAILVGFPRQAAALLARIEAGDARHGWWEFADGLAAEDPTWRSVRAGLHGIKARAGWAPTLEPFRRWAPRVARFSLQASRLPRLLFEHDEPVGTAHG